MTTTTVPELPACLAGDQPDSGLRVWCGHCRRWHYHGPGYGHRVAHCHRPGSPYERTGYVLTQDVPEAGSRAAQEGTA